MPVCMQNSTGVNGGVEVGVIRDENDHNEL